MFFVVLFSSPGPLSEYNFYMFEKLVVELITTVLLSDILVAASGVHCCWIDILPRTGRELFYKCCYKRTRNREDDREH